MVLRYLHIESFMQRTPARPLTTHLLHTRAAVCESQYHFSLMTLPKNHDSVRFVKICIDTLQAAQYALSVARRRMIGGALA